MTIGEGEAEERAGLSWFLSADRHSSTVRRRQLTAVTPRRQDRVPPIIIVLKLPEQEVWCFLQKIRKKISVF